MCESGYCSDGSAAFERGRSCLAKEEAIQDVRSSDRLWFQQTRKELKKKRSLHFITVRCVPTAVTVTVTDHIGVAREGSSFGNGLYALTSNTKGQESNLLKKAYALVISFT